MSYDTRPNLDRKALLALPKRQESATGVYESITIVPTRRLHDSGYRLMAFVGRRPDGDLEVAGTGDDIMWSMPEKLQTWLRMDMDPRCNCVRVWGRGLEFRVELATGGSTSIEVTTKGAQ